MSVATTTGRVALAIVAAAVATGFTASAIAHSGAAAPPAAQRFLAPTGADSNPCTRAAPCLTLDRGYRAARPGEVVELAAGTYAGDQIMRAEPSKTSGDDVVFRPAAGATAVLGQLELRASHVTLDGSAGTLKIRSFEVETDAPTDPPTTDVTIQHVDARGGQSQVQTARNVTLRDVDLGGTCDGLDALRIISNFNEQTGSADDPHDVLVEDSRIGGLCRPGDEHPDCVAISGGIDLTFRRNRISRCGTQGFYAVEELGGHIENVLVENNWFGECDTPGDNGVCFYSVHIRGGKNFVIRYNALAVNVPGGYHEEDAQVLLYGNAGEGPACDDEGTTYAYNVWDDAKCSATDLRADPQFVKNNGDDFDLHVLPTSPVIGRGDPARFPAVDRDGQQRISPPDAGADERPWLQASVNGARVALTRGGKRLTRIPAGTYKVIVADRTKKENLFVRGPRVSRRSSVAGTGTTAWKLTLRPGTYRFGSDRTRKLAGVFTVTAAAS